MKASGRGRLPAPMERDAPERHGVDSAKLAAGIREIRRSGMRKHSLVVVRDGALLSEYYYSPSSASRSTGAG